MLEPMYDNDDLREEDAQLTDSEQWRLNLRFRLRVFLPIGLLWLTMFCVHLYVIAHPPTRYGDADQVAYILTGQKLGIWHMFVHLPVIAIFWWVTNRLHRTADGETWVAFLDNDLRSDPSGSKFYTAIICVAAACAWSVDVFDWGPAGIHMVTLVTLIIAAPPTLYALINEEVFKARRDRFIASIEAKRAQEAAERAADEEARRHDGRKFAEDVAKLRNERDHRQFMIRGSVVDKDDREYLLEVEEVRFREAVRRLAGLEDD
jgi:hypothetical protein